MKSENYRLWLISFLQQSPTDGNCLQCWLQVRSILDSLESFKHSSYFYDQHASTDDNNAALKTLNNTAPTRIVKSRKESGKSWTRNPFSSSDSSAISSIKIDGIGSGSIVDRGSDGRRRGSEEQADIGIDYSDPLGAFSLLLLETRKLHRKYFNYNAQAPLAATSILTSSSTTPEPTEQPGVPAKDIQNKNSGNYSNSIANNGGIKGELLITFTTGLYI